MVAVVGLAGHRKGARGIVCHIHASFGPVAAEVQRHKLGAALINVVLAAVGDDRGRLQHNLDILRNCFGGAAKIVGAGLEDDFGGAFLQEGGLLFTCPERVDARFLPRLGSVFVDHLTLTTLLDRGGERFDTGRIVHFDDDRSGCADSRHRSREFELGFLT